jgi:hypothetical protein
MALDVADPLDAACSGTGFFTGRPWSDARRAWAAKWSTFPVYADKQTLAQLVGAFGQSRVTVVVSATGSGKTVICPALMMRMVQGAGGRVAITVPKRAVTLSAAERGAVMFDVPLGREVGYQYRGAPPDAHSRATRLVYSTDGTLLAQARRDPLLRDYAAVLIDEVHERPVPTDLLMHALRRALAERPDLRLVLMSATIDPAPFVAYYRKAGLSVAVVNVAGGTMYPVEQVFLQRDLRDPADDYLAAGLRVLRDGIGSHRPSSSQPNVLFFVPTSRDAVQGCRAYDRMCSGDAAVCEATTCAALYSKLSKDAQDDVLRPADVLDPPKARKLVFATNVAESSLTLGGLGYVVDSGLQLTSVFEPDVHGVRLLKGYATRAQILQRVGRVGRTAPGTAYMLYSRKLYDSLPMYPVPSIASTDVTEHLFGHLCAGASLADAFEVFASLVTPVSPAQLAVATSFLHFHRLVRVVDRGNGMSVDFMGVPYGTFAGSTSKPTSTSGRPALGAEFDGAVTPAGLWVAWAADRLKLSLWNALLVCAGVVYGCAEDAHVLASILEATAGEVSTLFVADAEPRKTLPPKVFAPSSDHETLVRLYKACVRAPVEKGVDSKLFVEFNRLGLSLNAWRAVHERVQRGADALGKLGARRPRAAQGQQREEPEPLWSLPATIRGKRLTAFTRALMASRMYHVAVKPPASSSAFHSVAPPRRCVAAAAPELCRASPDAEGILYEQLLETSAGRRFVTVTFLPRLPLALRP